MMGLSIKKVILVIIFALCIFLYLGYINSSTGNEQKKLSSDKLVKINESINISLETNNSDQSELSYEWTANIGKIDGQGANIAYTAPEEPGTAIITATIKDRGNNTYKKSVSLVVYKQFVIIKADDLGGKGIVSTIWIKFFEYIEDKNIKASVGIIGSALETNLSNNKRVNNFVNYLKKISKKDNFEFWNHGYRHNLDLHDVAGENISEFWRTSYKYQKEHLLKTQDLAKEKLNLIMHTFGAPCNKIDNNTVKALEDISDIKVWFFGDNSSGKMVLEKKWCLSILEDNFSLIADYEKFIYRYYSLNCDNEEVLVLQVHPDQWNNKSFERFKKIIDFLIEQNVTFINPYEYYQLLNDSGEIEP